ncbi:hypothetical protein BCh11DRAFT_00284 [Burkholderia sp. Ch1-1]|nr:hypothetical protein BCh11DRAFT_00284 [Burkholderia sp. Ch1-1]
MSRAPLTSGRYVLVETNGTRQWARDQVALQSEIVQLLAQHTGLTKKRIIMALSTAQAAIETALNALLEAGKIERYRAMSVRRRMDEHWCLAGAAPTRAAVAGRYNAAATLAAMQQHAAMIHARSANR